MAFAYIYIYEMLLLLVVVSSFIYVQNFKLDEFKLIMNFLDKMYHKVK